MLDGPHRALRWNDARVIALIAGLLIVALVDLLIPQQGIRTFLIVPVVVSIAFGSRRWTGGFGAASVVLYLGLNLAFPVEGELFWRRLILLVVVDGLSVLMAGIVGRMTRTAQDEAERFRVLAENSSDVVFRGSNDGVLEWISPQTEKAVGWTAEEMVNRPFSDFVHPDDLEIVAAAQQDLGRGSPAAMRVRIRTSWGEFRWMSIAARPLFDLEGKVVGRTGGWVDIQDVVVARQEAEGRRAQIQAMVHSQIDPFIYFTPVRDESGRVVDLRFTDANPAAFEYNNSTPDEMLGHTFLEFFPGLLENGPMAAYLRCAETGEPVVLDDYSYPNEILGEERHYDIRAARTPEGMVLTWRDVTDRHRASQLLADSEERYRLLAENATDVIWQVAEKGTVEWASDSTLPVLGWSPESVRGTVAVDYIHPDDQGAALAARGQVEQGSEIREEYRIRRSDGSYIWMVLAARGIATPLGTTRIVTLRDVDSEVTTRRELSRLVGRDPLTGLVTRETMEKRLAHAMRADGGAPAAILCIGIDSLSVVNEAFTHAVGDLVIVTIASRIVAEVGDADLVARGAGVDFLVQVPPDRDPAALADAIRHEAKQEVVAGSHRIHLTVSVGIASSAASLPEALIQAGTLAMRKAKDAGRDRVAFADAEGALQAERRLTLAADVAHAFAADEITMWFQPIADLISGEIRGYEALARWVRSNGSVVEPAAFMPALTASPMISQLDEIALSRSLDLLRRLPSGCFTSVNVSPRALTYEAYPDWLLDQLHDSGVDPATLHLEVTETALLEATSEVTRRMQRIADAGVLWYVDDFGTGFSSISHLRDLPVSGLKLDLSFTAGIAAGDERSIRLAQALVGMAQGLGLDTIAEGVETRDQAAILLSQGWHHGQGWLYGKAEPLEF